MSTWIFQGNPNLFDIDNYLKENQIITWTVRQKQYIDIIKEKDMVFIWRSDGKIKNSGGVVALCEVVKAPYIDENEEYVTDLKVLEYRLNEDEGMLLRSYLKEVPKTMDLPILKMTQSTNYKLTDKESEALLEYWQNPKLLKDAANMPRIEKYLQIFKEEAETWFDKCDFIKENYEFFTEFKKRENLEKMEWEDIQALGEHINAFRMALARKRALGKPNADIEKYRNSFIYLIYGDEPLELRIDKFLTNEEYSLFGFGNSALSEIIGNIYAEQFCFFNQRDKVALENILGIIPPYSKNDKFSDKFIKFHKAIEENKIKEKYLEVVGKQTNLPIFYEIDQFFSFLYEKYGKVENYDEETTENNSSNNIEEYDEKNYEEYNMEQLLKEVFISADKVEEIIDALNYKKNIILQGPPGVGKTYIAKRIAFAHSKVKDITKIAMIQFHPSYSYEDFIRGYKPSSDGNFKLKNGIFYDFCNKAINDPEHNYYIIIDEINRGNLSKIFGELMMLIESDKRGFEYAVTLAYSEGEERFFVPENLYIIGTMNTADRSIALVDYALMRRFSFIELDPAFETQSFKEYLIQKGISRGFIDKIIEAIKEINNEIENDKINLGRGFKIGHSYFCPANKVEDEEKWFKSIVKLEIEPLLREYYFNDEDKVSGLIARLK